MADVTKKVALFIISLAIIVSMLTTFFILGQTSKITKIEKSQAESPQSGAISLSVVAPQNTVETSRATVGLVVGSR